MTNRERSTAPSLAWVHLVERERAWRRGETTGTQPSALVMGYLTQFRGRAKRLRDHTCSGQGKCKVCEAVARPPFRKIRQ